MAVEPSTDSETVRPLASSVTETDPVSGPDQFRLSSSAPE